MDGLPLNVGISVVGFIVLNAAAYFKRYDKRTKRWVLFVSLSSVIAFWLGYLYNEYFVKTKCEQVLACVTSSDTNESSENPIVWNKLSEEVKIRGKWDTTGFKPSGNAWCTEDSTDIYKLMWLNTQLSLIPKKVKMKFYVNDTREDKNDPMFFIYTLRTKNPETGIYELPVSSFSLPVDGKTRRIEFKEYSKDEDKLVFVDNSGTLQEPVEEGTQIELEYEPESKGRYFTQYYSIYYNPIGENDSYVPSNLKPFTLDKLPFSSFDGALVQMGIGVTVGGCIQDFEYYIEPDIL